VKTKIVRIPVFGHHLINTYLLLGRKPILVDCGIPGSADRVYEGIIGAGVDPADLAMIVVTHAHIDHFGSANDLHLRTGAPVAAHEGDLPAYQAGHSDPAQRQPIGVSGRVFARTPPPNASTDPLNPQIVLKGDYRLDDHGVDARIIHTPGHTPGSVSVLLDQGDLIAGDMLSGGFLGLLRYRPSYPPFHDDREQALDSLQAALNLQPHTLHLGHGGPMQSDRVQRWLNHQQPRAGGERPGRSDGTTRLSANQPRSAPATGIDAGSPSVTSSRTRKRVSMSDATSSSPTVVLVHGAFADASGFASVIGELEADGISVRAWANPLRGLSADAAGLQAFVGAIPGPVVLVGHSYGGAVVTQASAGLQNVQSLVYLAAFGLDEGESGLTVQADFPATLLASNARPSSYDAPGAVGGPDLFIDHDLFRETFCADIPVGVASVLAASQRPLAAAALGEPCTASGWKNIPSWFLISDQDGAIHPDVQRFMAERMKATTETIQASHVAFMSQPVTVAGFIKKAL
jgi:glyoxylase-like metal-dependent hydrolase (beta-lactamase superfamily II)